MSVKLVDAIKRFVDKSSIGMLPDKFTGMYQIKLQINEGGVQGAKEHIYTKEDKGRYELVINTIA